MSLIGIITALPEEARILSKETLQTGECHVTKHFIISVAGIGAENATNASRLLHQKGATLLISWGCAGALDPQLCAGDLILPDQVCNQDGLLIDTSEIWKHKLFNELSTQLTINSGLLSQSPEMITCSEKKQRLFKSTSAVAVDMESYAVADYAQQNSLEFIAIRTIADTAHSDMPLPVIKAMDTKGKISNYKVLLNSLIRPWTIPSLIHLGCQFKKAQTTLTTIADKLIQIEDLPTQSRL